MIVLFIIIILLYRLRNILGRGLIAESTPLENYMVKLWLGGKMVCYVSDIEGLAADMLIADSLDLIREKDLRLF